MTGQNAHYVGTVAPGNIDFTNIDLHHFLPALPVEY